MMHLLNGQFNNLKKQLNLCRVQYAYKSPRRYCGIFEDVARRLFLFVQLINHSR